jgi:hypothetical protein
MTSKNDILTSILTFFCQKFCHPSSERFYCYYRPPERWRSPAGPWSACSAAPVNIPISFWSRPRRVRGEAGSRSGRFLALSQCSNVAAPFWADSQDRSALLHTRQIPGEVSLHLVKARSKPKGPR